jgi:hypothetical protein
VARGGCAGRQLGVVELLVTTPLSLSLGAGPLLALGAWQRQRGRDSVTGAPMPVRPPQPAGSPLDRLDAVDAAVELLGARAPVPTGDLHAVADRSARLRALVVPHHAGGLASPVVDREIDALHRRVDAVLSAALDAHAVEALLDGPR